MNLIARVTVPCLLASVAWVGPSISADYDPPLVIDAPADVEEFVPVEVGNGWYLRGDVGYAFSTKANGAFNYRTFDAATSTYGPATFDTGAISGDVNFNIGFGYQYNEYVRGDLTLSTFDGRFSGTTSSANPCVDPLVDPAYAGTSCRSTDLSGFNTYSLLANGYVDLGTYVGLTPYVGAGAGMTYVSWDNLQNTTYCVPGAAPCPVPAGGAPTTSHPGESSWRFSYALMGGVAFDVSKNLKVDLGYKYQHVGGGAMFGFDAATTTAGARGNQGSDPGFSTHEVRLGVRYALW